MNIGEKKQAENQHRSIFGRNRKIKQGESLGSIRDKRWIGLTIVMMNMFEVNNIQKF
jgi:hypothetical protein